MILDLSLFYVKYFCKDSQSFWLKELPIFNYAPQINLKDVRIILFIFHELFLELELRIRK